MTNIEFFVFFAQLHGPLVATTFGEDMYFCASPLPCRDCLVHDTCYQFFPGIIPSLSFEEFQLFSIQYPEYLI